MASEKGSPLWPVNIYREGEDKLIIEWNDGKKCTYTWSQLRRNCPCASCREEREKPPDPFRILSPNDLVPLKPTAMEAVGRYAYKIVWSDGHDTGIFTLVHLRDLCERTEKEAAKQSQEAPG